MSYFEGKDIKPRTASESRALIGARVKYVRKSDIDRSGRGYFFPRIGNVEDVHRSEIMIDGSWYSISSFVEMVRA